MHKPFILKIGGIFVLIILMTWAIMYINSLILERQHYSEQTKSDIAKSSAGEQTLAGPILVIPYHEIYELSQIENNVTKKEVRREEHIAYFMPDEVRLTGGFSNEFKRLGIYKTLMYVLGGEIEAKFNLPENLGIRPTQANGVITLQDAYLSIGISDPRGITQTPTLLLNQQPYKFAQGSQIEALGNGIHANLGQLNATTRTALTFNIGLHLRGMENFHFTPLAETNQVSLHSSWQHPHFNGSFLPEPSSQQINAQGFKANWSISALANSNQAHFFDRVDHQSSKTLESLSIGFVEPINVYSQADRATKYGLLFIGLTFVGFFLFELLKQLRIHPAQYTLVGLAMAIFYLLLISLAEHIGFTYAYISASVACVALLGYYLSHVLHSQLNGLIFASLLTGLYGALFGILASEDNALLMGAILVFCLLSLTMMITRKVDWYALTAPK